MTIAQQVIDNTLNAGESAFSSFGKVNSNFSATFGAINNSSSTYQAPYSNTRPTTAAAALARCISVMDFSGVDNTGTTDSSTGINNAVAATVSGGVALFFPPGIYLAENLSALAKMNLVGSGANLTTIRLASGTNTGLITSSSTNIDDVYISGIRLDGNSSANTSGDVLTINGARATLFDLEVVNAAGNGIVTGWNSGIPNRFTGLEGFFSRITIDSCQRSGWLHTGPSDSHFESIIIADCSLAADNTDYFMRLSGTGNGRFFNLHPYNRSTTTNTPQIGVSVESFGSNFSGCHFEGSHLPLSISGSGNTFAACAAYGTRGTYAASIIGAGNIFHGALGLNFFSGDPAYKGINLASSNCIIDVTNNGSGLTNGVIDFTSDGGENIVRVVGFQSSGTAFVGTPAPNTEVFFTEGGSAGALFVQNAAVNWNTYIPTIASSAGSLTTASATGRYRKIGKVVHFQMAGTITTNGTGSGSIVISLPFAASSSAEYIATGRCEATGGKMLQAQISASSTTASIFNYDNTYPAASGSLIIVSGTYESAT